MVIGNLLRKGEMTQFLPMRYKRNCVGGILVVCLRTVRGGHNLSAMNIGVSGLGMCFSPLAVSVKMSPGDRGGQSLQSRYSFGRALWTLMCCSVCPTHRLPSRWTESFSYHQSTWVLWYLNLKTSVMIGSYPSCQLSLPFWSMHTKPIWMFSL